MRSLKTGLVAAAAWLVGALPQAARADLFQLGSTYTVSGDNLPSSSLPATLTLNGLPKTIGNGPLTVSETFVPGGGNSTWLQVNFFTSDHSPIAVNPNAGWTASFSGIQFSQLAQGEAFLFWFDRDGVPAPQTAEIIPGFPVIPNPIPGESGVVSGVFFPPSPPGTFTDGFVQLPVFSSVAGAGIPLDVNGFHIAEVFTPVATTVPEPSSFTLLGVSAAVIGVYFRARRGSSRPTLAV
jgi:hypothetical protein